MTTGQEIRKIFENKVDKSYSKFLDNTKMNRLFKMALSNLSEKKYMGLTSQKEYDELRYQVRTEQIFSVLNSKISIAPLIITNVTANGLIITVTTREDHNLLANQDVSILGVLGISSIPDINGLVTIFNVPTPRTFTFIATFINGSYQGGGTITHTAMIDDYQHLFAVKCKTKELLRGLQVSECIDRTPCIIKFNKHNNFATGEKIIISDHPNNSINGTFYYEALSSIKGKLWRDKKMSVPVRCSSSTTQGGSVSREYYNWAEPIYSDRKISAFEESTADNPKVATADAYLKFTPDVSEITIDYFSKNLAQVDVSDNINDLELVYPFKFLMRLVDEAIMLYTSPSRDVLLAQLTDKTITP